VDRPLLSSLSLMCSYFRSSLLLHAFGIACLRLGEKGTVWRGRLQELDLAARQASTGLPHGSGLG
jgi:hypothetical protein